MFSIGYVGCQRKFTKTIMREKASSSSPKANENHEGEDEEAFKTMRQNYLILEVKFLPFITCC